MTDTAHSSCQRVSSSDPKHGAWSLGPVFLIALTLGVGITDDAHAAAPFSIAISGYHTGGCGRLAFPLYLPSLEWVVSPRAFSLPVASEDIAAIDSADGEHVFAILRNGGRIVRVIPVHAPWADSREPFFNGVPGSYGRYLAVAKSGRVFATVYLPGSPGLRLAVISSSGSLERLLDMELPATAGSLAVASDGCTVFFTDGNFIRRLNGCTGESLPWFSNLGTPVADLAVLSTGEVLAVAGRAVIRLNADGTPMGTFSIQGMGARWWDLDAVGVSTDESVIGVAAMRGCDNGGTIVALALTDGRELWRMETSYISTATGLVVGAVGGTAIPTLSESALLLLAVALALTAARALGR